MITFPQRGEIFYAQLPNENKQRPVVIVSIDGRNRGANSVLVVPLTTNLMPSLTRVEVSRGDGGLQQDSVARCEQITDLRKDALGRGPLGATVSTQSMARIERGIMRAVGIPAREPGDDSEDDS